VKWYQAIVFDQEGTVGRAEITEIHLAIYYLNFRVLFTDGSVIDIDMAFPANDISSALQVLYFFEFILIH
jgi:hypothetical protein